MKKPVFGLLGVIVATVSFYGCGIKPTVEEPVQYAIGDIGPSGVGIVFYVTDGGSHGLEAAPFDLGADCAWIEGGDTQTTENGNTSQLFGTGRANSDAIIAQTGHTGSAAKVCRDYSGGGLTDWYLPSLSELDELYEQRAVVGGFDLEWVYWSSSEYSALVGCSVYFMDGSWPAYGKVSVLSVRAIRSF